jgi:DNA-binding response OmpR family regulator
MLDPSRNASPSRRTPPAVLLVEPEPMLRLTVSKFLGHSGCRVTACADGGAGAAVLMDGVLRPALIMLEARVLDADLAEVAHRLRELAPGAQMLGIADIVAHGGPMPASLPRGLRFLAPPFDFADVLRAVRSCLRHGGFRLPDAEMIEA